MGYSKFQKIYDVKKDKQNIKRKTNQLYYCILLFETWSTF